KMLFITKRLTFSSAHRLFNPKLSDDDNSKIFGKCSFPGGHGHNYTLEVSICGEVDSETGMIIDIKQLKEVINREIISKLDHKNLNTDVDFLKDTIPTVENMAVKIWDILVKEIKKVKLYEIKLSETKDNAATYRGET
ncbi:MAG: 6-carboxytetrahydropterin synthase, partial [Candidatus Anammoxibacter sp.]